LQQDACQQKDDRDGKGEEAPLKAPQLIPHSFYLLSHLPTQPFHLLLNLPTQALYLLLNLPAPLSAG